MKVDQLKLLLGEYNEISIFLENSLISEISVEYFLFCKVEDGGESPRYTIDEALVSMGFGKFQILVLAYAGMGWA